MKIQRDGASIHYDVVGSGPLVLFIHGFPLSRTLWEPTAERLAGEFTCILPDLRGHGASTPTPNASIEQYANDLIAVLDAVAPRQPAVVCGLSMGGVIAFDLFRRHRARVRGLVLSDCRPQAETEEGRQRRADVAARVMQQGSGVFAEEMVGKLVAPGAAPELIDRWVDIMARTPAPGVAAAAHALAERPDSTGLLPQINVPTLLVFGEQDSITPPDVGREMAERIPDARLEIIAGAGHLPPVEQPERFAGLLVDFLRGLSETS